METNLSLDAITQIRLDNVAKSQDGNPRNAILKHLKTDTLEEFSTVEIFDMMLARAIADWSYEPFENPPHAHAKMFENRGLHDLKYIHTQLAKAIKALEI